MAALSPAARPDPLLLDRLRRGGDGCMETVRAHGRIRDGVRQMVKAHQRADPPVWRRGVGAARGACGDAAARTGRSPAPRSAGRRARRRAQRSTPSPQPAPAGAPAPDAVRRHLVSVLAPGGQPIAAPRAGARASVVGLPGGWGAARAMFRRLTESQGARDVTPPNYRGVMVELADGSLVGLRRGSRTGTPAIDLNMPGWPTLTRLHFF